MGKLPSRALVAVVWGDAHASIGDIIDDATIEASHRPTEVTTLGWLMLDDPQGVSVCGEYMQGLGYRGHTFIPRSLIQKIVVLKKAR